MSRRGLHLASAVTTLLLLVGVAGTSSAAAKPATVAMTCGQSAETAAAQLRALTLDQQRSYIATCGLPLTTQAHCFSLVLGKVRARCTTCHTQPSRIVFRS
jgi:hypothetical protein